MCWPLNLVSSGKMIGRHAILILIHNDRFSGNNPGHCCISGDSSGDLALLLSSTLRFILLL